MSDARPFLFKFQAQLWQNPNDTRRAPFRGH